MKALLYVDDTPLAALAALNETDSGASARNPAAFDFLSSPQDCRRVGRSREGLPVFALWYPASQVFLTRIVKSFCIMYDIPHGDVITVPLRRNSLFIRLVTWLYRHRLNRLAKNLLSLTWPRAGRDLVAHFRLPASPLRQGLDNRRRKR